MVDPARINKDHQLINLFHFFIETDKLEIFNILCSSGLFEGWIEDLGGSTTLVTVIVV